MYSPPLGGAARRLSATIDKQHTSNRRFITSGEEDYLCRARNSASGRALSPSTPSFRGCGADAPSRRKWQANGPRAGRLQAVATILDPLLRVQGHAILGVFGD